MTDISQSATCSKCPFSYENNIFTEEDIILINSNKVELNYRQGDIIIKQGAFASQIYLLKTGLVKIFIEAKKNQNVLLKILPKRSLIALPLLGDLKSYSFSAVALCDTVICQVRIDSLLEIMSRNVKVSNYFINWFSIDHLFLYDKIAVMATRNNHGKLASVLRYLSGEKFKDTNVFEFITRKDLAEMAAISIESTNKILQEMKNDLLIKIDNKKIEILKPDLIAFLSEVG